MGKTLLSSITVFLAWALLASPAGACPDCPEGIRKQVRAGIFDDTFAENVAISALPFGVLAAILAAIHAGLPDRRRRHG